MNEVDRQDKLVAQWLETGDGQAFERLLFVLYDPLLRYIQRLAPADLQSVVAAEDILQDTMAEAFRGRSAFHADGPGSFYRWLATIARHRVIDTARRLRSAKRGGQTTRAASGVGPDQSIAALVEQLANPDRGPSQEVRLGEAVQVMRIAMASLDDDLRQAVDMRYLQGMKVQDIAARLNRTDRAVHMLCYRGLQELRLIMGRASDLVSWST